MNIDEFTQYYKETAPGKQYVNAIADELNAIEYKIEKNDNDTQERVKWYGRCLKVILIGTIAISILLVVKALIPLVSPILLRLFDEVCRG